MVSGYDPIPLNRQPTWLSLLKARRRLRERGLLV
jgi:hypothetical protein